MGKVIVVTGTDTEVGKTFVTAALVHRLRGEGYSVRAIKPVESGCVGAVAAPTEDGVILATAAGQATPPHAMQRLQAPLAPPVAAKLEGVPIQDDAWAPIVADLADQADFVFVEAAGGLFSPLSERFDALSLARHLGADVLVVAADKLGSINHSRLTYTVLKQAGFATTPGNGPCILGVVFSEPAQTDESTGKNAAAFAQAEDFGRVIAIGRRGSWEEGAEELGPVSAWLLR